MEYILTILGWLIAIEGVFYILKPQLLPHALEFFTKGSRIYFLSVMWAALAAVMLVGAKECPRRVLMTVLALVLMVFALLTFAANPQKLNTALQWLKSKPPLLIRFTGVLETIFGLLVVYATM